MSARREDHDGRELARAIIDANLYMVLGTADEAGRPWVAPVYYAPVAYREFLWVSSPATRHSRNIAARADVSIVIFDSTAPIDTGNGVYMTAVAEEIVGEARIDAIAVFSKRSLSQGGRHWTLDDAQAPASLRPYRATVGEVYVLEPDTDRRVPVPL